MGEGRITSVVLVLVASILIFLWFQSLMISLDRSSLSVASFYTGLPLLGISRNSLKADGLAASLVTEKDRGIVGDDDLDDDLGLGDDAEILEDEFELDLGNGTVMKKSKDRYIVIEKTKSDKQQGLNDFAVTEATNSSRKIDDSGTARNRSISKAPSLDLQNVTIPIRPSEPLKPKSDMQMLEKYMISDMDRILIINRASPKSTIPLWLSAIDQEILKVRAQIQNAPAIENDRELYAPAFRNISMFKRSYELMEQILKVYIYKEGDRPIFHKPFFTGIYASEGWFMKHMQENNQFLADDPGKAHLFYMPFSSKMLQEVLYIKDSHSHTNLIEHLKNYVRTISMTYPFWNRTGGEDHFLAGCHDWATHETDRAMKSSIRALCNADVHEGFEIGKDVSLPETFVRNQRDPLVDLGGKPARKRSTLAFFAGNMHGYLRPILLQHWENKDPDMKIFGPIPNYVTTNSTAKTKTKKRRKKNMKMKMRKLNMYIEYMKDSKYCICPRGYEVNSPRIVEAIFYECVPVIIADNFVPPFFEVLNWEAFSLILPESDVPRLKQILTAIPRRKYQALHEGVRSVQKHFLWNIKPVKYDLFHMILHSVWFNRVFSLRL